MSEDKKTVDNSMEIRVEADNAKAEGDQAASEATVDIDTATEAEVLTSEQNKTEEHLSEEAAADQNRLEKEDKVITETSVETEPTDDEASTADIAKKKRTRNIYKTLRIIFTVGFFVFTALFLNEVWLQPFLANRASSKAKDLFDMPSPTPITAVSTEPTAAPTEAAQATTEPEPTEEPTPTPDPTRDAQGRLLIFRDLLNENEDVKGWIKLDNLNGENDTKIDYVVMQSSNGDPEYYLTRDWQRNKVKAGSLFLDYKSSVEKPTQNLVIHGHNMTSSDDMFHYLLRFNEKKYYNAHPIIDFNTIFATGQWKIFAVFITNGSSKKEPFFDYTKAEFKNSSDFLNFVYQLRIRSIYNADDVDINENDQILTLSTCSYEVKDYRTVIVARKVRDGEDPAVNTDNVQINPEPLYPESYYYRYGGKAPKLPETFEEAVIAGDINWYQKAE
jgi:sortase B